MNFDESVNLFYHKCGFKLTNWNEHAESSEYGACSFQLNDKKIQFRKSKITPTKTGQFVTIWKRNADGITEPFDASDDLDYIIITAKKDNNFGQFIFPKEVLIENGIISNQVKTGKRGIRVYPPWDKPTSKQGEKTQKWQLNHFVFLKENGQQNQDNLKKLLT